MRQEHRTYEAHCAERRGYGWRPLDYETWKSWYDADVKRGFPA